MARLRIVDTVEKEDVKEAMRLMEQSKDSLNDDDKLGGQPQSVIDRIYGVIREMAGDQRTLKISDIKERCMSKGFKPADIEECIDDYENLNIFHVNQSKTKITLVDV